MSHAYPLRREGKLDLTTRGGCGSSNGFDYPQIVVLALFGVGLYFAWIGAFFAILLMGSNPKPLFDLDLDVGVLRCAERVNFYFSGALATGRYPPFSLEESTDYPADLEVAYPEDLNRWLVLVKWLPAIPRLIIVGILVGGELGRFGTARRLGVSQLWRVDRHP
jgi:hypothetical protein